MKWESLVLGMVSLVAASEYAGALVDEVYGAAVEGRVEVLDRLLSDDRLINQVLPLDILQAVAATDQHATFQPLFTHQRSHLSTTKMEILASTALDAASSTILGTIMDSYPLNMAFFEAPVLTELMEVRKALHGLKGVSFMTPEKIARIREICLEI